MTLTTSTGEALAICSFVASRIGDELQHEADRYHHDSCWKVFFRDITCDCDGPQRTRETLESILSAVTLCCMQIEQDGQLNEDVCLILRALSKPYRNRADFPAGLGD